MAPHDLERARKLAASFGQGPQPVNNNPRRTTLYNRRRTRNWTGPSLELYAQLVIAGAIADSNPAEARKEVEEAIAELHRRAIDEPSQPGESNPMCLIAGCLPLIEKLMPERIAEYLWLALACRPPRGNDPDLEQLRLLANLAGLLARYDRVAAQYVAGPVFDQVPVPSRNAFPGIKWTGFENVFPGLACLDPSRACDLIGSLPDEEKAPGQPPQLIHGAFEKMAVRRVRHNGASQYPVKLMSRIQLAESLLLPIERRRLEVLDAIANPWLLDPDGQKAR